jgi:hypothetical protein
MALNGGFRLGINLGHWSGICAFATNHSFWHCTGVPIFASSDFFIGTIEGITVIEYTCGEVIPKLISINIFFISVYPTVCGGQQAQLP